MKIRPLHIVSTATLGLAGVISSANNIYAQQGQTPLEIENKHIEVTKEVKKIVDKKLTLSDDIIDDFVNTHKYDTWQQRVDIIKALPLDLQAKIAKKVFSAHAKALKENTKDLSWRENWSWDIVWGFTNSPTAKSIQQFKNILEKSNPEYQALIEANIGVLSDPKNIPTPSELQQKARMFNNIFPLGAQAAAPPGLFKEAWYTKIDSMIDSIKRESNTIDQASRDHYIHALVALATLEQKSNSGIKDPKVFTKLLDLTTKDLDSFIHYSSYRNNGYPFIHAVIANEAIVNDNPKGSRILKGDVSSYYYNLKVKAKDSLIEPYEKYIQKIISNPPRDKATEQEINAYNIAIGQIQYLASAPLHRSNCLRTLQDIHLSKIGKIKIEDVPDALNLAREKFGMLNYTNVHDYDKLVDDSKKHLRPLIENAFQYLLDNDSKKSQTGRAVILSVKNYYEPSSGYGFRKALDIDDLYKKTLEQFQNKALKDETQLASYIDVITVMQNENKRDLNSLNLFISGINNQLDVTHKDKKNIVNALELKNIHAREQELLKAANQSMDFLVTGSIAISIDEKIKIIEPLFEGINKTAIKDSINDEALNGARELLNRVSRYPTGPDNKEGRRFFKETIVPYLNTLLESSRNLSSYSKKNFQEKFYQDLTPFFRIANKEDKEHGNFFILDDVLQSVSKNFFNLKDENKLEQFMYFPSAVVEKNEPTKWHPYLITKLVCLEKDYLNNALKEANGSLNSKKSNLQITTMDNLISYRQFLLKIKPKLDDKSVKDICTQNEYETVKNLIDSNLTNINNMLIDKFAVVRVTTERTSNYNHVIDDDVFKASFRSIEELMQCDPELKKKCVEIIDARLKTESDPRTRGMLYRSMSRLSEDKVQVSERFKKAILTEASPITAQYIGQELGEMFHREIKELPEYKRLIPPYTGTDWNGMVFQFGRRIELVNKDFQSMIKTGKINPDEKTRKMLASDTVLFLINSSRGYEMKTLLKEGLDEELFQKLNSMKPNDPVDPRIIKACYRIMSNSSNALSGFIQKVSYDEVRQNITWMEQYDKDKKVYNEFSDLNKSFVSLLERNLRWGSGIDTIPHVAIALLHANNDNGIDLIGERIFGTKERLGMFELYEGGLQNRFVWQYLENYEKRHGKDKSTDEACRVFLRQIEAAEKLKNPKERASKRRDIGLELIRLDSKLYAEMVRTPVERARLNFFEEFVALAPSRQRIEYINIALNTFGLRNHFSEQEVNRVIGGD